MTSPTPGSFLPVSRRRFVFLQDRNKTKTSLFLYLATAKKYPRKTTISNFKGTVKENSRDL
jgi:hypothetical protein